MHPIDNDEVTTIATSLEKYLGPYGFEFQPFKIAWYNALVQPTFKINFNEDTLAFLVISTPKMFENAFIPFLKNRGDQISGIIDPIDECMKYHLSQINQIYPGWNIKIIHDFELQPNRRPKVVMQSIAHASGAAYLYHPTCVTDHDWKDKKMYGVCIHPRYGGWFALRAVIFLDDFFCPDLPITLPYDVVPNNEDRIRLLELYNFHWEDWRFRDIIPVAEKYSELQIKYFSTPPGKRGEVIKSILNVVNGI